MPKMKRNDFINMLKKAADSKTLYVLGCIGAPMTPSNKSRYTQNYSYNRKRAHMINSATDDTFGFDCVCLVKSILWGWVGDKNKVYGGATYASNGVPDYDANMMIRQCYDLSATGWDKIEPGEFVWKQDHCGVYIGNGQVIECTPTFGNGVCYTNLGNIGKTTGWYRNWTKHGKLPYVDYSDKVQETPPQASEDKPADIEIAYEVIRGEWGSGADRKKRLTEAGYNYDCVQDLVNKILNGEYTEKPNKKTNEEIAKEVIRGKWGSGADRKKRLTEAGYDYNAIQSIVNKMLSS